MLDAILNAATLILSLIGLFSILWYCFCYLACDKDKDGIYTVVTAKSCDKLPDKLYSAMLLTKYRPIGKREIYVIDDNVPYHTKQLCHSCIENMGRIYFVNASKLSDIFEKKD